MKLGVPLNWGQVSWGPSRVASRVSSTLTRFKRECGVSVQTLLWKSASSRIEGIISWFFSSCGGKRGVPLELQRGSQGLVRVASDNSGLFSSYEGPVGIPLESLLVNRSVSRVHSELSVSLGQRLGSWASYQGSTR